MKDFMSIGEILIDFTPFSGEEPGMPLFQMNPGGAPANVACVLARLGHETGFIGKVGDDIFGHACINALNACGVDTKSVIQSGTLPTTLAFVYLDQTGNRSFSFYRKHTADVDLSVTDLQDLNLGDTRIFHFGSVSLSAHPSRDATVWAVMQAKKAGCLISCDPNLRPPLWSSMEEAAQAIRETAPLADILKLSAEEGEFLFGETDGEKICRAAQRAFGVQTVLATLAREGCMCAVGERIMRSRAYDVRTVDTTGAGDAFFGGILHCLLAARKAPGELTDAELSYMLDFGNAAGSLTTAKKGSIPAIPSMEEIEACMRQVVRL